MPVSNLITFTPRFWIPPPFTTEYKVTVEDSDGTVHDLSDRIIDLEVEDAATDGIGRFRIEILNHDENFLNTFSKNDIFRYYKDYAASATTLRFLGRVEKPDVKDNVVVLSGRSESIFVFEKTVTKQYTNTDAGEIIEDLFQTYGTEFTTTGVDTSVGTNLSPQWYQKPFWEAIQEISMAVGYDIWIDPSKDVNFFKKGSLSNTNDAIVHDYNLWRVKENSDDNTQTVNRVIVYGATIEGTQIIHTEEDITSGEPVKEEIVNDENITSQSQAEELAQSILDDRKNPPKIKEVTSQLLAGVAPGELMRISDPQNGIDPGDYKVLKYMDKININQGELTTTVTIEKEPRSVSDTFKRRIETESRRRATSANPNEMRFSYNFRFNEDSGVHVNTEITQSILKLASGQSSGEWTSPLKNTSGDVTDVQLDVIGETLTGATFEVSADGGVNYQTIAPNSRNSVSITDQGTGIRLRITFNNSDTQVDSIQLLYKTN